jgi:hypothetical protein
VLRNQAECLAHRSPHLRVPAGRGDAAETLSAKQRDWTLRRNGGGNFNHLRAAVFEDLQIAN